MPGWQEVNAGWIEVENGEVHDAVIVDSLARQLLKGFEKWMVAGVQEAVFLKAL